MKSFVLSFTQFVNESKEVNELPYIYQKYKSLFDTFDFEKDIPEQIETCESKWIELKRKYNWNTRSREYNGDHFVINMKVYIWPDINKAREVTGIPELEKKELTELWNEWFSIKQEDFINSIDYSWIKNVYSGGSSGGWLILGVGSDTDSGLEERLEEHCIQYKNLKTTVLTDDRILEIVPLVNNSDYQTLIDLGLTEQIEEIKELIENLEYFRKDLIELDETLNSIESNIQELLTRIENFRKNGLAEFYEYIKDGWWT